jgi:lambda family phage portal protein
MTEAQKPLPASVEAALVDDPPKKKRGPRRVTISLRPSIPTPETLAGHFYGGDKNRNPHQRWDHHTVSPKAQVIDDLPNLRDRSEHLVSNTAMASAVVKHYKTNVVGRGVWPRPQVNRQILKIAKANFTDQQIEEFEDGARELFRMWGSSTNASADRRLTWPMLQSVVLRSILVRGDALSVRRYKDRKGWPFRYCQQVIEGDRLESPQGEQYDAGVVGGIKSNADGEPEKYWITNRHPGDVNYGGPSAGKWYPARDASGAELIRHLLMIERPGQPRGIPLFASAIEEIRSVSQYKITEEVASALAATLTVLLMGEAAESTFDTDIGDPHDARPSTELGNIDLGAGVVLQVPAGDVKVVKSDRPGSQFEPFLRAAAKQIGMAVEVPAEVMEMLFSTSYTAGRASMQRAWKTWLTRRSWLIDIFGQPTYEDVVSEFVATGQLYCPGFFGTPLVRYAFTRARWLGPTAPAIDPLKEAKAAEVRMDTGVTTLDQETEAMGGDWEANLATRIKIEKAGRDARKAAGLPDKAPVAALPPAPGAEDESEEDEEERASNE